MEVKFSLREEVFEYVTNKYKSKIEYLWSRFPNYAVFRNDNNKKWYGIIMDIPYKKLGINQEGIVDILNVKVENYFLKELLTQQKGFFNGYHISKGNWVSILLDGTVDKQQIYNIIDDSFDIVNHKNF